MGPVIDDGDGWGVFVTQYGHDIDQVWALCFHPDLWVTFAFEQAMGFGKQFHQVS